jgi:hypothetical protein
MGSINAIVKSGKREFLKLLLSKGGVHFLAKKCYVNVRKSCQKGIQSVLSKKIMPIICIKVSIIKHPCMAMCKATNSKGDKGRGMRKRRSP